MTALVRHHFHVILRAIEVAEHKRHSKIRETGAVTASGLAFLRDQVEESAFIHHPKKLSCFRRELVIHARRILHDGLCSSERPWRRFPVQKSQVPELQLAGPDHVFLLLANTHGQWYDMLAHFLPQPRHLGRAVVGSEQKLVGKGDVVPVAEQLRHFVPQFHEAVINLVERRAIGLKECESFLRGLMPNFPVFVLAELIEPAEVVGLSLKLYLCRCDQVGVLHDQFRLFAEMLRNLRVERLHRGFHG